MKTEERQRDGCLNILGKERISMTTQSSMLAPYDNKKKSLSRYFAESPDWAPLSPERFCLGCWAGHVWKELGGNVWTGGNAVQYSISTLPLTASYRRMKSFCQWFTVWCGHVYSTIYPCAERIKCLLYKEVVMFVSHDFWVLRL